MNPYEEIEQHLMRARGLSAKEGRADYDMDAEYEELYKAYIGIWKRLEVLRPGSEQGPQDKDVRL